MLMNILRCRRLVYLLATVVLPLLLLGQILIPAVVGEAEDAAALSPYDVIINEWSQGNGGSKEWFELLVVNGPVDLQGWTLGNGTAAPLTFAANPLWHHLPAGSLVVIYNQDDRDPILPPDDIELSDFVVIIDDEDPFRFSGRLPEFPNDQPGSNPILKDRLSRVVHDFSTDPGSTRHPQAQEHSRYTADTAAGVSDEAYWTIGPADEASPAAANGGANSTWVADLRAQTDPETDLILVKTGPLTAAPGSQIVYEFSLANGSGVTAPNVMLTDTLPSGLTYVSDDSYLPLQQPDSQTLVWQADQLAAGGWLYFHLTTTLSAAASGVIINRAEVSSRAAESMTQDNSASLTTEILENMAPKVVIDAVLYDGYEANHADEAILLRNLENSAVDIGGWQLNDGESSTAVIPTNTMVAAGQAIWLSKEGAAFRRQFGFLPAFEMSDSFPLEVPNLEGAWPLLADNGDQVILMEGEGLIIDCLIYEDGELSDCEGAWQGPAVQPYQAGTAFAEEGQILYRRRDQATGLPVPDSDTAQDWAQARDDVINGRKVRYPGWDLEQQFRPVYVTETARVTIAIAPDNAYQAVKDVIAAAHHSIQIETLTFENIAIGGALAEAASRGVSVTVLLEGGPPGGITEPQKYNCQRIEAAGGQCWFMVNDASQLIFDRYRFLHAKFMIIDGQRALISSENLSPDSLPDDDKQDGTWGRRGVILITDAAGVVGQVQTIFDLDFDWANHGDLLRWQASHPTYGAPRAGFVPDVETGGITYTVNYPIPLNFEGTFSFGVIHAPENSLRTMDGIMRLLGEAGNGDTILVQQLVEQPFWGTTNSEAESNPNPRLAAYIDAARRGARVRILLDAYFDDADSPISNFATCQLIRDLALREHLRLDCALANPTGLGIHNKMILAHVNGRGYSFLGSLNGSELSHKGNREMAVQLGSDEAYALLAEMFNRDWPDRAYLPLMFSHYVGPAGYPLISEVHYDPPGQDDKEFIELVNPTGQAIDLSFYSLGDAVQRTDFEDVRRFPEGTTIGPGSCLVVAGSATAFYHEYGFNPDYEILDSDPVVPGLIDDLGWGDPAATLQLGNEGDEIILRDPADRVVDVVAYGSGAYPQVISCTLVTVANASLERFPFWRDTDDCSVDFREWPYPNPGVLP